MRHTPNNDHHIYWVGQYHMTKKIRTKFSANPIQVTLLVKNPPANAGNIGDVGSIPGLERSSGGEHSNPLQYSCLENPKDSRVWQATIHRVAKTQAGLKLLSMHTRKGATGFLGCLLLRTPLSSFCAL